MHYWTHLHTPLHINNILAQQGILVSLVWINQVFLTHSRLINPELSPPLTQLLVNPDLLLYITALLVKDCRRSSTALIATITVERDMNTADTAGLSNIPHETATPAASGSATIL